MLMYYSSNGVDWILSGTNDKLALEDIPKTLQGKTCMWWAKMILFVPNECYKRSTTPERHDIAIQVNDGNMFVKMKASVDTVLITGYPTLLRYLHTLLALDCVICGHNAQRILLRTARIPQHKWLPCCLTTPRIADQTSLRTILMGHSFVERRRSSISRKSISMPRISETELDEPGDQTHTHPRARP